MPWSTLTSPGGPCSILAPLAAQSSGRSGLFRSMTVRSTALSSTKAKRTSLLVRFASDSPLEGDGFEPSVPRQKDLCLNSMTRALVDPEGDPAAYGIFTSTDNLAVPTRESPFANIVSVTFSAFDDFTLLPERRNVSRGVRYSNVGLRKRIKDKSNEWVTITRDPTELAEEFSASAKLCIIGEKAPRWRRALVTLEGD